ncbi:DNA-binding helix-turn-helix protein [Marvinbryantia formatexigens DSM 14469]|uniref:DNA-binding helix-turn-helix protein n=1 Tax=Marvinbryantia formatexigens DSM 14469 TaxID=478749 RepID=C6L9Y0_9FIRM|nr:helix-turn-helix transcriptional regulator [Marvinbryantia formatexigens]EET62387.1 DNA-binding helix-turn-helix protein [Marvinbryantia formatexigens DSM 14469]UWO25069.1 helix-turn-helix transcriptional regulator [Marvinbryantia formatexigens DSM 14469]
MELKNRLQIILDEQHLKQKDFAQAIKVTESYVSNMLNGKRKNISESLAVLIEQTYGYSSQWILTGEGERYITQSRIPELSPTKKRLISEIEKMSDAELDAVLVFINSLDDYKKAFNASDKN